MHVQAVKQEYYNQDPVTEPLPVSFAPAEGNESMKLHLDLEKDGVDSDGWKITPLVFPPEVIPFTYIAMQHTLPRTSVRYKVNCLVLCT